MTNLITESIPLLLQDIRKIFMGWKKQNFRFIMILSTRCTLKFMSGKHAIKIGEYILCDCWSRLRKVPKI